MKPSFHIVTFGCQMNEHDSERISGILEEKGFERAPSADAASMIVLNTCSIRQKAEQKFYSELGRLRELKQANPGLTIAVAGCIAQQEGANLFSRAPQVDLVLGPSDIAGLPHLLDRARDGKTRVAAVAGDSDYHKRSFRASRSGGIKAWVSIMYGCDNFCSYCVVPFLRGRERSRPSADILHEVRGLAEQGYREVTLLGQNVNSYGRGAGEGIDFPALLRLLNDESGIERIRFVTSHPKDLSDGLIAAIRDLPSVCEAVHLPVQSGSDRILVGMNRGYTAGAYLAKLRKLRDAVPGIVVTTDVIAGFPGETADDYEATLAVLREADFDGIFAFRYSKRPHTAALNMPDHVDEKEKERRLSEVLALQREITLRKNDACVGNLFEVLADGHSKRGGALTGRTRGNKTVNFPGPDSLVGRTVTVRILSAGANSFSGELCA